MNLRVLALLSISLFACADEPLEAEPPAAESSAPAGPSARVLPKGGKSTLVPSCETMQDQARRLLPVYQRCEQDADCALGSIHAPCLLPFLCPIAANRHAEIAYLAESAQQLSASYQKFCGDQCPVVRCISPESTRAYCDTEVHLCKSGLRSETVDASTPAPLSPSTLDAGL